MLSFYSGLPNISTLLLYMYQYANFNNNFAMFTGKSSSNASLHGYSGSLSRAITDIAIKDATGSFPSLSLSQDESSHNSLSTVLTLSNASTPVNEGGSGELPGQKLPAQIVTGPLADFAGGLVDNALRASNTGLLNQGETRTGLLPDGIRSDRFTGDSGMEMPSADRSEENLQSQAKHLVSNIISNAVGVVESTYLSTSDQGAGSEIEVWGSNDLGATLQSTYGAFNMNSRDNMKMAPPFDESVHVSIDRQDCADDIESWRSDERGATLRSTDDAVNVRNVPDSPDERDIYDSHKESANDEIHVGAALRSTDDIPIDATEEADETGSSAMPAMMPPLKHESQVVPFSQSGDSRSSKGSLGDFSFISSTSCPSCDSFVKLNGDADIMYRQRHPNQAFSAEILAGDILQDALATLQKHFSVCSGIHTTSSKDSLADLSEVHSATSLAQDTSGSFENLTSGDLSSSPSSEYVNVRITKFSIGLLAEGIISSAFEELNQMVRGPSGHPVEEAKDGNEVSKIESRGYVPLTEEDIRNGNTLPSDSTPSASTADSFAEKLIGQIFQESLQGRPTSGSQNPEDPGTPPPSPSSPISLDACLQISQSFDKSLVTISEQPVIAEPQYDGNKRLSADSSGTESSQSREARIRECAEQLVARTLPESVRLLGGSAQTTSSSSSRRSSARSSIPSSSNRSSMDCFTEDLLKIANIDPMGKRPSRTEENLAFFAQEIKRMAEAEEKCAKKQKEDFADFTIELQRRSSKSQVHEGDAVKDTVIDSLAGRQAVEVISDVFVQLFGKPWSEAEHTDDPETEPESQSRPGNPSVESTAVEERPRRQPSEQDLICMATNLANSIIEAALKVYREEHLHLSNSRGVNSDPSRTFPQGGRGTRSGLRGNGAVTLEEFTSAAADSVIEQAMEETG